MTHVRVWKFRPRQGRQSEFATAYASDGVWSKLFSKACGYRGTVLLSPGEVDGWWLTIDRWDSAAHFEAFQNEFGEQYRTLDISLEGVAGNEEFVGVFEDNELPRAR